MVYLLISHSQEVYAISSDIKDIVVSTEYIYYAPSNVNEEEAKFNALQRAKFKAIEDQFGTTLQQNNSTTIKIDGEKNDVSFFSQSSSEVSGEWIETIGQPIFKIWYDSGLVVKVNVKGRIRPIAEADTPLDVKILCNGTSGKFERTDFRNGDDLFVQFTSPIDGYIAVYLYDMQNVYCLLPYPDDGGHAAFINGGKTKTLFSYNHKDGHEAVKQYHMTCENDFETNLLYVIFSPNQFDKAIDYSHDRLLPGMLSHNDFIKWVSNCKRRDKKFQVKEFNITISK